MGVMTIYEEHYHTVPPSRIFKASILDSHNLVPKLMPQVIKNVEYIYGNGGAGSIKQINFAEGREFKQMKYHIDELDEEMYTYSYTLIEGETLIDELQKISYEVKLEHSPNGGTIAKVTSKYYTHDDFELNEEDIKAGKEKVLDMYKVVEAYLIQNPNAYV